MNLEMASFVLLKFSSARAVAATSVASLNRPRFRLQLFAKIVPAKLADGLFVPMIRIKEFHSCHPGHPCTSACSDNGRRPEMGQAAPCPHGRPDL